MKSFKKPFLLVMAICLSMFSTLNAQPNGNFKEAQGITFSVSDMLGGFATLSFTSKSYTSLGHLTISSGYMIFDGLLPEYYLNYQEPEISFREFKQGFLLSFAQSINTSIKERENFVLGYMARFIYRRNTYEFDSHAQILLTLGYHLYAFDHILVYPAIQLGWGFHYAHQSKYDSMWDKQNGIVGGLSLNVGYMF